MVNIGLRSIPVGFGKRPRYAVLVNGVQVQSYVYKSLAEADADLRKRRNSKIEVEVVRLKSNDS